MEILNICFIIAQMCVTKNAREVELSTLNNALLWRQPKLCEDSFSFLSFISFIFVSVSVSRILGVLDVFV